MNKYRIIEGDCREGLKQIADDSVHTCITSPPYFGLRSYNGGQSEIGCENEVEQYVKAMVDVFREVRRVLRPDGTVWLNLGDSYMAQKNVAPPPQTIGGQRDMPTVVPGNRREQKGLKHKDLIGIPWRVAFALQADGWWLRQDIIWHKPNPMPESVMDRCTRAHEYIFMLTKKSHYYYDHDAIKEPAQNWGTRNRDEMRDGTTDPKLKHHGLKGKGWEDNPMKNKRSVWTVNTKGYKGAHFAVYPKNLILPCVLAGTSAHGCCSECGAPWEMDVDVGMSDYEKHGKHQGGDFGRNDSVPPERISGRQTRTAKGTVPSLKAAERTPKGWKPTCKCKDASVVPCTVLDPFTGSGTTAVVAMENGRDFVGCELNPDYIKLAEARIAEEVPSDLDDLME